MDHSHSSDLATTSCTAPPMKDLDYEARLLCVVDDMCTQDILDCHLGFVTHKTQVEPFTLLSKKEHKFLDAHKMMYRNACASSSRFVIERCALNKDDGDVGAKVVASKDIKSGTVISELCGRLVTVRESFIKPGQNEFSAVHSTYKKRAQLWLGPATYANHDCESNCDTYFLKSGVACLRTNRSIRVGEEITTFYGPDYFGANRVHCLCLSCKQKGEGAFRNIERSVGATPFLECAYCGATFRFKSWLLRHMSMHGVDTGKFSCVECGASFTRKFTLHRHANVHGTTKSNYVKCNSCPKEFSRRDDCLRHETTVHRKISIHKCPDCQSTFSSKKYMMYHHNRKHSGLRPYPCPHCVSTFPAPNTLYNHKKRQH